MKDEAERLSTFEKTVLLLLFGSLALLLIDDIVSHRSILTTPQTIYSMGFRSTNDTILCFHINNITDRMECLGFREIAHG